MTRKWRVVLDDVPMPGVPDTLVALIVEGEHLTTVAAACEEAARVVPTALFAFAAEVTS